MDPLTAGALTGISGIGGAIVSGIFGQNSVNQQEAYQTQMADTAYQRQMADMQQAGLNPMLAMNGGGAPSPMGGAATMPDISGAISTGANTATAVRAQNQQQEVNDANIDNLQANADYTKTKGFTETLNQHNIQAQEGLIHSQIANAQQDVKSKALANQLASQTMNSQIKKAQAEGDFANVNQMMGVLGAGASTAKSLLGLGLQF